MRRVGLVIAVALLGMTAAGCASYHRERYAYAYGYPGSYTVYPTAPVQVAYVYPTTYTTYRSYDYDRYYRGIHPPPELNRIYP